MCRVSRKTMQIHARYNCAIVFRNLGGRRVKHQERIFDAKRPAEIALRG